MAVATHPSTPYAITSITYNAESATTRGKSYAVTVTDAGWACSCKAGAYTKTRGRCWHLKAAQAGELGRPRVRILPLPVHVPGATIEDLYPAA